jgi:hypothetical protein
MDGIRKEVVEFSMRADVLLHGNVMNSPLNEEEAKLLEAYITRLSEKLKLAPRPSDAHADQEPKSTNGQHRRMAV